MKQTIKHKNGGGLRSETLSQSQVHVHSTFASELANCIKETNPEQIVCEFSQ